MVCFVQNFYTAAMPLVNINALSLECLTLEMKTLDLSNDREPRHANITSQKIICHLAFIGLTSF